MGIEILLEENGAGSMMTCSGVITGKEAMKVNDVLSSHQNMIYQIWDFSLATDIQVDIEQMHMLIIQDNAFSS
ncbi:MAG: hypothetical protein P8Y24_02105 [Gammaproteobacteria bacterium]